MDTVIFFYLVSIFIFYSLFYIQFTRKRNKKFNVMAAPKSKVFKIRIFDGKLSMK